MWRKMLETVFAPAPNFELQNRLLHGAVQIDGGDLRIFSNPFRANEGSDRLLTWAPLAIVS